MPPPSAPPYSPRHLRPAERVASLPPAPFQSGVCRRAPSPQRQRRCEGHRSQSQQPHPRGPHLRCWGWMLLRQARAATAAPVAPSGTCTHRATCPRVRQTRPLCTRSRREPNEHSHCQPRVGDEVHKPPATATLRARTSGRTCTSAARRASVPPREGGRLIAAPRTRMPRTLMPLCRPLT